MKFVAGSSGSGKSGRTPSGVRGLKSLKSKYGQAKVKSHPVRGAWIEIPPLND